MLASAQLQGEQVEEVALITQAERRCKGSWVNPPAGSYLRYEVAPVTHDQPKVGSVATPVAPFPGAKRVGAGNVESVVKLHCPDQVPG
jgi:hypothetical protein